ncbi:TPA: hypothetical protein ACHSIO_003914 [Clostridioides difficile]
MTCTIYILTPSYAKMGCHYAGFVPTEIDAKGCMRKIDLIFEKED